MDNLEFYGLKGVWAAFALLLGGLFWTFRWLYRIVREVKSVLYAHKESLDDKDIELERRIQENEHNFNSVKESYQRLEHQCESILSKMDEMNKEFQTVKEQNAQILGWLSGGQEKIQPWKS